MESGLYDSNLGDIMQNERQIDRFLDVVFDFLHRRTDFYWTMKNEDDSMGLPPGLARKYVMQAYMKYECIAQGNANPADVGKDKKPTASEPYVVESVESEVEVNTNTEVDDLPSCSSSSSGAGPSTSRLNPDTGEVMEAMSDCSGGKDSTSQKQRPAQRPSLNTADTYNGALRENYAWSQTLKDVDLKVFVPPVITKAKQLTVDIGNDFIKIAIKGSTSDGVDRVLIESKLKEKIRGEETIWSLDPGNCVQLNLEKRREMWWKGVLEDEPEIDQKSIDNTQYVHEMDDQSQADYQRVMYDMERKRQGLPSSKEQETHDILKKAWNAEGSPFKGSEFDPSKINISAS